MANANAPASLVNFVSRVGKFIAEMSSPQEKHLKSATFKITNIMTVSKRIKTYHAAHTQQFLMPFLGRMPQ
jgi:hypothetical protein